MRDRANDDLLNERVEARPVKADDDADGEAQPRLYYGSVDEFVREYLRHVYRRRIRWSEPRVGRALVGTRRSSHPTGGAPGNFCAKTRPPA